MGGGGFPLLRNQLHMDICGLSNRAIIINSVNNGSPTTIKIPVLSGADNGARPTSVGRQEIDFFNCGV